MDIPFRRCSVCNVAYGADVPPPFFSSGRDAVETARSRLTLTFPGMQTFVVRVWVPDRPGALGQVASRIGAVRGDVVGIEILERGAGRAVDELVVELPEDGLLDLLITEISQVDGVDVEDVRTLGPDRHDPGLTVLATATRLIEAGDEAMVLKVLCEDTVADFE